METISQYKLMIDHAVGSVGHTQFARLVMFIFYCINIKYIIIHTLHETPSKPTFILDLRSMFEMR